MGPNFIGRVVPKLLWVAKNANTKGASPRAGACVGRGLSCWCMSDFDALVAAVGVAQIKADGTRRSPADVLAALKQRSERWDAELTISQVRRAITAAPKPDAAVVTQRATELMTELERKRDRSGCKKPSGWENVKASKARAQREAQLRYQNHVRASRAKKPLSGAGCCALNPENVRRREEERILGERFVAIGQRVRAIDRWSAHRARWLGHRACAALRGAEGWQADQSRH